jgi:glycosyltransferase involved in cell wall biosynthesis
LSGLEARYSFNQPFFILPNQFWAHKNHKVVISALKILKRQGKEILILATGNTESVLTPSYFPSLMSYAKECGVLSHYSIALINPSRFEGWSTSVEESKSLGKTALLSDIPVHREQSPALGTYFNPDDAEELAQKLVDCYASFQLEADMNNQRQARLLLPARQRTFGRAYQDLVSEAAAAKK